MLVLGLAVGRWWFVPVGAAAWALLLLATGVCTAECIPGALALGGANTLVGVAVRRSVVWIGSRVSRRA